MKVIEYTKSDKFLYSRLTLELTKSSYEVDQGVKFNKVVNFVRFVMIN